MLPPVLWQGQVVAKARSELDKAGNRPDHRRLPASHASPAKESNRNVRPARAGVTVLRTGLVGGVKKHGFS